MSRSQTQSLLSSLPHLPANFFGWQSKPLRANCVASKKAGRAGNNGTVLCSIVGKSMGNKRVLTNRHVERCGGALLSKIVIPKH